MKEHEICATSYLLIDDKKNVICHALCESAKDEELKRNKYLLKSGIYFWHQLNQSLDGRQETIKTDSYIILL